MKWQIILLLILQINFNHGEKFLLMYLNKIFHKEKLLNVSHHLIYLKIFRKTSTNNSSIIIIQ